MASGIITSNNTQGNNKHYASNGQFASANATDSGTQDLSFLEDIDLDSLDLSDFDLSDAGEFSFLDEKPKFEFNTLRTVDEVVENVGNFFDDDTISFLQKNNFKVTDNDGKTYPSAGKTSHSYLNNLLINEIAKKNFVPMKIISDQEFANLKSQIMSQHGVAKHSKSMTYIERGFHNRQRMEEYIGNAQSELTLPAGAYGSCIYTAYNSTTAKSYASGFGSRGNGFIMEAIVDNQNGNTITYNEARRLSNMLVSKRSEIYNNLKDKLSQRGYDDNTIKKISHVFMETLRNDETAGAFFCGYDCVYETTQEYGLVLNFKNVVTHRNW